MTDTLTFVSSANISQTLLAFLPLQEEFLLPVKDRAMKTLEYSGNSTSRIIEASPPVAKPHEVLIQTARSAICGSEMKAFRGAGIAGGNGGHEAVGTIVAVGDAVRNVSPGQRVGVSAVAGCGDCPECAHGRFTWCKRHVGYSRMHAEQFVISSVSCHQLPDDLPWDEATLLTRRWHGCALAYRQED